MKKIALIFLSIAILLIIALLYIEIGEAKDWPFTDNSGLNRGLKILGFSFMATVSVLYIFFYRKKTQIDKGD
jgi:uncharacterized membrane protein (DUF441 family)